jgi:hypothetical protein
MVTLVLLIMLFSTSGLWLSQNTINIAFHADACMQNSFACGDLEWLALFVLAENSGASSSLQSLCV